MTHEGSMAHRHDQTARALHTHPPSFEQDQRIQQIFSTVNAILSRDGQCASRALSMRTYSVLPLNERVGLIEWMDGTAPLMSLITKVAAAPAAARGRQPENALMQADALFRGENQPLARGQVPKWISRSRAETVALLARTHALVPLGLLSRGIESLATGAESYLGMRSNFSRSLAALTIVGHILGIGDRHSDNFMVETRSGRVVGIDFGHAFGSATFLLPQPELVGVRLTRQLTSFLRPLDAGVLLKCHMTHVLRALRAGREELLRVMDVFVSEPQVNWGKHAKKLSQQQRSSLEVADSSHASHASQRSSGPSEEDNDDESVWVRSRMASVTAKLNGGHAAHVTVGELKLSAHKLVQAHVATLSDAVLGPEGSRRRALPAAGLTAEQQVDVLVELATDPNVLGRTYHGWKPWL